MTDLMRAVGYRQNLPISDPSSLLDLELPVPEPGEHDLRVRYRIDGVLHDVMRSPRAIRSRSSSSSAVKS